MSYCRAMDIEVVRTEIEDLHEFFVDWLGGGCARDEGLLESRFADRLADDFALVPPGGRLLDRGQLIQAIRQGYGRSNDFRIAIRNVCLRRNVAGGVMATYEEWQRNAVNSTPPNNGRIATVYFVPSDTRPSGLQWLHVHETWLPQNVIAAGPYDF